MAVFDYSFTVDAPVEMVSGFHHDTSVLKLLTPPPLYAQIHAFEPLGDGSKASFTLWFGPIPIRWKVVHTDVDQRGFTDIQVQGPLRRWRHTHRFRTIDDGKTRVDEHIEYEHRAGLRGLFSRLLFSRVGLYVLFTARKQITRKHVKRLVRRESRT